ncbi:hypothetical protein BC938DRAFT_478286 [Jimgerdemannia flammicorona]|uniref:Peptidase S8/S53 domain-containing protein n=1 Tax=Jimgerdemannia flammicorona TaxID=994334 RepID=A0A433QYH7_9FUNG|nr:hypothetical protein BC938DRAFT_478286 [Jimgerdemannia flammicorona]
MAIKVIQQFALRPVLQALSKPTHSTVSSFNSLPNNHDVSQYRAVAALFAAANAAPVEGFVTVNKIHIESQVHDLINKHADRGGNKLLKSWSGFKGFAGRFDQKSIREIQSLDDLFQYKITAGQTPVPSWGLARIYLFGIFAGTKYGVAKKANIVYVKVLDCKGSGTTSGVISGVKWVTNNTVKGKSVINMLLGGGASAALDSAVAAAVTVFVAAGNENQMPAYLKTPLLALLVSSLSVPPAQPMP